MNAETGERHIAPDRVGHQIDVVAQLAERLDPVVLAERRAPGLEKRLGGLHQDAERAVGGGGHGQVNVRLYLAEPVVVTPLWAGP
jgi:hypothetical protein